MRPGRFAPVLRLAWDRSEENRRLRRENKRLRRALDSANRTNARLLRECEEMETRLAFPADLDAIRALPEKEK